VSIIRLCAEWRFKGDILSVKAIKSILAVGLFLLSALILACSDDKSPLGPSAGEAIPVTGAAQLAGNWGDLQAFAGGLPLNAWTIPAFAPGVYDSRLTAWTASLTVTRTGENSAVFAAAAAGVSQDTSGSGLAKQGQFDYWGEIVLDGEGWITVTPRSGRSKDHPFYGQASLLADTLVLNFTFSSPPEKAVGFLPASTGFIARLVRQ